ncbi:MAG: cytochrome c family protein [Deltaproteobacteria bacterium]|nr:cytochrome c family protein [Deltaproteobacteria bacterium]
MTIKIKNKENVVVPGVRICLLFLICFVISQQSATSEGNINYPIKFVGVSKCRKCHEDTNKIKNTGNQFSLWQQSAHSKAFKTLKTRKAKKTARKMGIKKPHESEKCLVCHRTAFKAPSNKLNRSFNGEDGVQCESCHGAGGKYSEEKTMKKIARERKVSNGTKYAKKWGLSYPDEKTCLKCHTKSIDRAGITYFNPTDKPFDYKAASLKIIHKRP